MTQIASLASLATVVVGLGLFIGCADPDSRASDDLDGESADDGEDGKQDGTSTFTYYFVTPKLGPCRVGESCAPFNAARVNRSTTACSPGVSKATCPIQDIDWTATGLDESVSNVFAVKIQRGAPLVVRATLDADTRTLVITELWEGAGSAEASGTFVLVRDNGKRCAVAPCHSLDELRINSTRAATITGVDFEPAGADESAVEAAGHLVYDRGILVAGERDRDPQGGRTRTATQFYLPVTK